jgi:hypothetical protein
MPWRRLAYQGISLAKAENACANVSVWVTMAAPRPIMATAPSGSGCAAERVSQPGFGVFSGSPRR